MHNYLDESTIERMLDCIYEDVVVVRNGEFEGLNVAPIFSEMLDDAHYADGYHRILEKDQRSVWLFSWSEHHKAAYTSARALGCIFPEWVSMSWLELAERIVSGELNDLLVQWDYEFLCHTPLPVDDEIENISWI